MQSEEFGPYKISGIEFAKRLRAIRDVVPEDNFNRFIGDLVNGEELASLLNAMDGLSQEDEFAIMTRLMGTASLMIPLDQTPILATGQKIPDFLAVMNLSDSTNAPSRLFQCLIEVKSTSKSKWKLSSGSLSDLRSTAAHIDSRLVFAVRFLEHDTYAYWVIVEDDGTSSPITITKDAMLTGIRHQFWNDLFIVRADPMEIRFQFSETYPESGYSNESRGYLGKVTIHTKDHYFEAIVDDIGLVAHVLRMFGLEDIGSDNCQGVTTVRLRPTHKWTTLADTLFHLNKLAVDKHGHPLYDPPRIIATSDNKLATRPIQRDDIEPILRSLAKVGLVRILSYEDFMQNPELELLLPQDGVDV